MASRASSSTRPPQVDALRLPRLAEGAPGDLEAGADLDPAGAFDNAFLRTHLGA